MSDEEKIAMILEWASERDDFDPTFVENLYERLDTLGMLTPAQSEALDNIIDKWGIGQ